MPKISAVLISTFLLLSFTEMFSTNSSLYSRLCEAQAGDREEMSKKYQSKIGSTLSWLLKIRNQKTAPEELRVITKRETVGVSIRFDKELDKSKVEEFEKEWLHFKRLPSGDLAKSGPIYGAEIAWENICDFAELNEVARIESIWKPAIAYPSDGDSDLPNKGEVR